MGLKVEGLQCRVNARDTIALHNVQSTAQEDHFLHMCLLLVSSSTPVTIHVADVAPTRLLESQAMSQASLSELRAFMEKDPTKNLGAMIIIARVVGGGGGGGIGVGVGGGIVVVVVVVVVLVVVVVIAFVTASFSACGGMKYCNLQ